MQMVMQLSQLLDSILRDNLVGDAGGNRGKVHTAYSMATRPRSNVNASCLLSTARSRAFIVLMVCCASANFASCCAMKMKVSNEASEASWGFTKLGRKCLELAQRFLPDGFIFVHFDLDSQ